MINKLNKHFTYGNNTKTFEFGASNITLKQPDIIDCSAPTRSSVCHYHIWQKWGAPNDIILSWPFVMLGEAIFEREVDPPGVRGYHVGGFSYPSDDILHFTH